MLLFCDVDGVLIPFPAPDGSAPSTHQTHWADFPGRADPVKIWLNPVHGRMLAQLVHVSGLNPVWCTTWRSGAAPQIGSRLGLPLWPSVALPDPPTDTSHPNGYLWKRDALAAHAAHAPFAWIDDDFTSADHAWAAERDLRVPTLLVETDPHTGLLPEHLDAVRAWASSAEARQRDSAA